MNRPRFASKVIGRSIVRVHIALVLLVVASCSKPQEQPIAPVVAEAPTHVQEAPMVTEIAVQELETPIEPVVSPPAKVQTKDKIAEHLAFIEANPDSDQIPNRLFAIGRLYKQERRQFAEAVEYFSRLIREYPDAPLVRDAYILLAECYKESGDAENQRWVYRQMMEHFPEDTQEHRYARQQLGL